MPLQRLILFLLCAVLVGCATEPAIFGHFRPPPPGMAMVVLYRVDPNPAATSVLRPAVLVNGRASWPLLPGKYLHEVVAPGLVALVIERRQQPWVEGANWRSYTDATVEIKAEADITYFVELAFGNLSFSFRQTDIVSALSAVREHRPGN